jgi:hypothetical protein
MNARRFAFLLVLAAALAARGDDPGVERAHEAKWSDVTRDLFDTRWILPEMRADPWASEDERPPDMRRNIEKLLTARFPGKDGETVDPRTVSFADALVETHRLGGDVKLRDAFLDKLKRERPDAWRFYAPELPQMGREDVLDGDEWKPSKDSDADGMIFARSYRADCAHTAPWTGLDKPRVQQAAIVVWADLDAIEEADKDYPSYRKNVESTYNSIYVPKGSYVKGVDDAGRPFAALRIVFQCELPFPYSHYDCDLRELDRIDAAGRLVVDAYSTSKDFNWLASEDVFYPLETASGEWVGTVIVRAFGVDLAGVPDGESDARESVRGYLGNLKRRADAAYRDHVARGGKPRTTRGAVPDVPVRGVK